MKRGFFITFEGGEGAGKSTQAARLATRLRSSGHPVRQLREPGGTPLAEEIRHTLKHSPAAAGMCPETELLLMNAARAQLVREIIRPALDAGEVVVCDRFLDSTLAYQGWGRELPLDLVRQVLELAVGSTRPDLTLLLRLAPEIAASRRKARVEAQPAPGTADRFEAEDTAFFARVGHGFEALAREEPTRIHVIDASPSESDVESAIWRAVVERLGVGDYNSGK